MTVLSEIAEVIRSKNAGPFVVTFDIFFKDQADFEAVRGTGLIDGKLLLQLCLHDLRGIRIKQGL